MPTQNSPICLLYITNLFEEPQIGVLFYRTEWQRRPTDIHLRRWKALQPPPPPTTHTIIPAHRSNSCVSADCTLSRAHDQETTWKKGNADLARVFSNLGRNGQTSQRSRLMTLHTVTETSKIYLVLSTPRPPQKNDTTQVHFMQLKSSLPR
jgi:hypothetical protein